MISISGGILSSLIDEANACPTSCVQQGIVFGNKICRRTEVLSDTQDDKVVDEYHIGITSYLNLREHHPFWPSPTKIVVPSTVVDRGDVVGIFVIRRDGVKSPSLRDIMIARHLEATQDSALIPFLILLINIDSNQCSWVYEMHYSCFGVQRDSPKTLLSLDLKIPSLSADSAADYKSSPCLNSDATILNYMGEESAAMMSGVAATTVHNSVDTELLAVRLIDEIKDATISVTSLEMELSQLRKKVEKLRRIREAPII